MSNGIEIPRVELDIAAFVKGLSPFQSQDDASVDSHVEKKRFWQLSDLPSPLWSDLTRRSWTLPVLGAPQTKVKTPVERVHQRVHGARQDGIPLWIVILRIWDIFDTPIRLKEEVLDFVLNLKILGTAEELIHSIQ